MHLLPGRNVIGLNALTGVFDFEQHRWVREHLEPGGHLGHTYLWYLVDDDTFNRFLYDTRRLFPDPFAATVCPDSLDYTVQPNGSEVPFVLRRMPRPDETSVACVVARRDTDVGFRVTKGSADVGVLVAPGECRAQAVQRGTGSLVAAGAGNARAVSRDPALPPDLAALRAGRSVARARMGRPHRPPAAHSGTHTSTSGSDQPSKLVPASSTRRLIPPASRPPRSNPSAALLRILPEPVHELQHVCLVQPRQLDPAAAGDAPGHAKARRERAVPAQGQDDAGDRPRPVERDLEELVAEQETRDPPGGREVAVRGGSGIADLGAIAPGRTRAGGGRGETAPAACAAAGRRR